MSEPVVGVIMGSDSDWAPKRAAAEALDEFGAGHEVRVGSAHRTPTAMIRYAQGAPSRARAVTCPGPGAGPVTASRPRQGRGSAQLMSLRRAERRRMSWRRRS